MSVAPSTMPAAGLRSPAPVLQTPSPDGFDLRRQLVSLWEARRFIAVLAVLLGTLGVALSLIAPRRYEATATLSLSPSKMGEQAAPLAPNALNFVPLIGSQAVADAVVKEFGLNQDPYGLTAIALLERVVTVRALPDSALIRVVVRLDEPGLATRVANRFADLGIAHVRTTGRSEISVAESELKAMLDQATERARAADTAYEQYRRTAQIELVRREVDTLLQQRADLMKVSIQLEAERGKLARAEQELSTRQSIITLKQSVVGDNPTMTELARAKGHSDVGLLGLELNRQERNPVFSEIDTDVAATRAEVTSLERQRARLLEATGLKDDQLARLSQLYDREATLDRLDLERRLARKSYEDVAARYQGAKLAAIGRTPQVQVVDAALTPTRPVSRYLRRNLLLGIVLGLLAGAVYALGREALAAS